MSTDFFFHFNWKVCRSEHANWNFVHCDIRARTCLVQGQGRKVGAAHFVLTKPKINAFALDLMGASVSYNVQYLWAKAFRHKEFSRHYANHRGVACLDRIMVKNEFRGHGVLQPILEEFDELFGYKLMCTRIYVTDRDPPNNIEKLIDYFSSLNFVSVPHAPEVMLRSRLTTEAKDKAFFHNWVETKNAQIKNDAWL